MGEIKNPFNFGTGNIDKDQWLKDIDNELEDFISKYGSATNKHRTALIRLAFLDLRSRIANGDMLGRTADGLYQFSSALNREDKHMQEAYQRALGFMGNLARRQINTPVTEPEKKKYSTAILNDRFIKYFNPSGSQESFTSLWNSYDDDKRKQKLKDFLNSELSNLEKNYLNVEDYDSMDNLKTRINEFLSDPSLTNLNRLGFNRNYLNLLKTNEQLEEEPKTEEAQVTLDLEAQKKQYLLEQNKKVLEGLRNANEGTLNFTWTPGNYEELLNNYFFNTLGYSRNNPYIKAGVQFELDEKDKDGNVIFKSRPYITKKQLLQNDKLFDIILNQYADRFKNGYLRDLKDYFNNFGTRYESLYNDNKEILRDNLSKLFATADNKGVADWENYFTATDEGYVINGSLDNYGNYAILTPQGIIKRNMYRDSYRQSLLQYKEGGVIKGADGFVFDASKYHTVQLPNQSNSEQSVNSELENSEKMDLGDIVNVAGPLALDIASMFSANGIGIGTAFSAGSGLASTVWQGVNDWDNNNVLGSLGSIGANLVADGIGLVPGLGISGKVGKIATGLAKHAKYLGYVFNAIGAKDASLVLYKGIKNGFNLSPDEWKTLSYGLAGVAQGAAGVKRANRTNLKRGAATQQVYNSTNKKGETYPIVVGIGDATPGKTRKRRYIANKNDILEVREKTLTPDWSNSMDRSFVEIMQQPRSSVILHPWESLNNPFKNPFSLEKSRNKFNSFAELWRKRKGKSSNTTETPSEKYGGILKALRNGGIIKALFGIPGGFNTTNYRRDMEQVDMSLDPRTLYYDPREAQSINFGSIYSDPTFIDYSNRVANGAAGRRSTMGNLAGTLGLYMHNGTLDYQSALDALKNYYTMDNGKNIMGDVLSYYNNVWLKDPTSANKTYADFVKAYNTNVDELRAKHKTKFNTGEDVVNTRGWDRFNTLHRLMYGSYGKYVKDNGEIGDDWNEGAKDILGESTWRRLPNAFSGKEYDKLRQGYLKNGDNTSYVYMDNNGHLQLTGGPKQESLDPYKVDSTKKDDGSVVDEESAKDTIYKPDFKNPNDPTFPIIAAKTAMGLIGNNNIYKNLLDEMPQAPLRDPIQRQLAIVGWLDRIKNGENQIADLRNINRRLFGSDLQTNFATSLETERTGRDVSDRAFAEDSGRQFETAQKLWNLKNEDTMYNIGVGDANRKSIADRARMMAQIRAAWRSGNNNILMGALSDTGNWLMKKYQTEADTITRAKELQLGDIDQYTELKLAEDSRFKDRWNALKAKRDNKTLTPQDEVEIQRMKAEKLKEIRGLYAGEYYNLHRNPLFGGGAKETISHKDGGSLEKEKLRARGKDNDRYVSMIKDLRTTTYRRRRRR